MIELSSIDSTNNYALSLLKGPNLTERQENVGHGSAVFAHEQFAGKGQRGKTWLSHSGENVHLSVIINPEKIGLQRQFLLIAIIALAVRDFFDHYAQSDISIKWPNDIYFKERKAGGILIENVISGKEWKWAVAGIGLNINQIDFQKVKERIPVSLKQITGKSFDCFELAKELRNEIMNRYEYVMMSQSVDAIIEEYNHYLFKKNEKVYFEKEGKTFEALVKEVLPTGQLIVQTDVEMNFDFGEVKWLKR
ncbi:biotin--[acetyl-CoA-carboxylase] ligase [Niabella ginsengisoli]|uniref:Biotin--[acetyl-CoA-carboxylase] ligase n=1 Tax=Niabella ginsengisoli TaxID=522298 RepID=A0ABS9SQF3_9BACT|nr:biotin--[acetyl-CoA-carboxylase] ligase [Niabella ginsengisoli]MCH5600349.1 biotin--[acetyl-CoA-carboxylase] ligase [Niabella ginsengisoli]